MFGGCVALESEDGSNAVAVHPHQNNPKSGSDATETASDGILLLHRLNECCLIPKDLGCSIPKVDICTLTLSLRFFCIPNKE